MRSVYAFVLVLPLATARPVEAETTVSYSFDGNVPVVTSETTKGPGGALDDEDFQHSVDIEISAGLVASDSRSETGFRDSPENKGWTAEVKPQYRGEKSAASVPEDVTVSSIEPKPRNNFDDSRSEPGFEESSGDKDQTLRYPSGSVKPDDVTASLNKPGFRIESYLEEPPSGMPVTSQPEDAAASPNTPESDRNKSTEDEGPARTPTGPDTARRPGEKPGDSQAENMGLSLSWYDDALGAGKLDDDEFDKDPGTIREERRIFSSHGGPIDDNRLGHGADFSTEIELWALVEKARTKHFAQTSPDVKDDNRLPGDEPSETAPEEDVEIFTTYIEVYPSLSESAKTEATSTAATTTTVLLTKTAGQNSTTTARTTQAPSSITSRFNHTSVRNTTTTQRRASSTTTPVVTWTVPQPTQTSVKPKPEEHVQTPAPLPAPQSTPTHVEPKTEEHVETPAPAPALSEKPSERPSEKPVAAEDAVDENAEFPSQPTPEQYKAFMLNLHNNARGAHAAPKLEWSNEEEGQARKWAEMCDYKHPLMASGLAGHGQNIAFQSGPNTNHLLRAANESFSAWYYGEMEYYNYATHSMRVDAGPRAQIGHFLNIVRKSFVQLACATHVCPSLKREGDSSVENAAYTVCNFRRKDSKELPTPEELKIQQEHDKPTRPTGQVPGPRKAGWNKVA